MSLDESAAPKGNAPVDQANDPHFSDRIHDYNDIERNAGKRNVTEGKNLDLIRGISIGIATKEDILEQSHGEVLISETINYRTQRPER